jgi:hypothetical protein
MNFRKHISILLAFFLLITHSGLAFNVHYCDDVIASITVFSNSNANEIEKNCCGIVEKDSKCCQNKIIKSEKKSDQILLKSFSFETLNGILVQNNILFEIVTVLNFKKTKPSNYTFNANAPPIFERNCQRNIYA